MMAAIRWRGFANTQPDELDSRFQRIVLRVVAVFAIVSIVVPFLPVREIPREQQIKVPERVAKVMMERKQKIEKPPEPKPLPLPPAPQPEKPKEPPPKKQVAKAEKPKPVPPTPKRQPSAKERVAKVGLLAMRDELAALRDTPELKRMTNPRRKLSNEGSVAAVKESKPVTRVVNKGSGGVSTDHLTRDTVQTALNERELTKVKSTIVTESEKDGKGSSRVARRSMEEIELVLERVKGSFQILYNRERRNNLSLRGTVLFELVIAPSGKVTSCKVMQSELNSPQLERKLVVKLKSVDFGERDVEETMVTYPINFVPS
ncbi:MAG: AgmX/PglI C-terminal domain-containing protein [Gammaproteobacteria bacterium]|nr:AgmX/PglI C-terminal domain-containing protein [Gammaproteobacteria bacterium]